MSESMTITQAATTLGLSRQLIHQWLKKGKLTGVQKEGNRGAWRIDTAAVQNLVGSQDLERAHKHRALLLGKPKKVKGDATAYAENMQG